MKQPLPIEFKNKFDEILSEIKKYRKEQWELEKGLTEYNNFGLMAFSVIAIVLVFLFIRDSVKNKQVQKYKQDCDLWWKNI